MPSDLVKSYSKKSGKTIPEVEKIWSELTDQYGKDYAKIVGALKKILKIKESYMDFKDYLQEKQVTIQFDVDTDWLMGNEKKLDKFGKLESGDTKKHDYSWYLTLKNEKDVSEVKKILPEDSIVKIS